MFDPFGEEEDKPAPPRPPFPTPTGALLLTFAASFASLVVAALFFDEIDLLALGVGEAFGIGGVATLAARRVPDPQPERLGLRGFSPRLLPALLCLVPLVFLTSEIDNWARDLDALLPPLGIDDAIVDAIPLESEEHAPSDGGAPAVAREGMQDEPGAAAAQGAPNAAPARETAGGDEAKDRAGAAGAVNGQPASSHGGDDADADASRDAVGDVDSNPVPLDPPEGWALAQIAIVTLGISPVVEGFLFFGVILQGLVTWLGRRRGLFLTGCLYALIHAFGQAGADAGLVQSLVAIASFIGLGVALGICRLTTGSVLAAILVETGFKGVALLAMSSPDLLAIPGYNVDLDAHTPLSVLIPSLGVVAWGFYVLSRQEPAIAE
jgi:membrane protease YdiL (CAAX protease family)